MGIAAGLLLKLNLEVIEEVRATDLVGSVTGLVTAMPAMVAALDTGLWLLFTLKEGQKIGHVSRGGIFIMISRHRYRDQLVLNKFLWAVLTGSVLQNNNESNSYKLNFFCRNPIAE